MSISSTIRHTVNGIRVSHGQFLQVRLNNFSRDIFRSSTSGVPNLILHESPSTLISDSVFLLPLSQLQDPFSCEIYIARLLSTLNLPSSARDLAEEITFYAIRFASTNNGWNQFCLTVVIDYIHNIWIDHIPEFYRVRLTRLPRNATNTARVDETFILGSEEMITANPGTKGASKSTIRRLKKETFVALGDELGDCCICYDDLCGGKEVIKMQCTHLFHGSCIIQWLKKNNSCPLCRTRVD